MSQVFKISEATSLAIHTMVWLAANPELQASTRQIAQTLHASQNHLAKVLQRLVKTGMVRSSRGPKGGFELGIPADRITLLDVFENMEGRMDNGCCLLGEPVCNHGNCIFGGVIDSVTRQIKDYMANKKLSDLIGSLKLDGQHEA